MERDLFLRKVHITNHVDRHRDVRLFFHYNFRILGREGGDTIYYHPRLKGLVAYQPNCYFLLSGKAGEKIGIDQWTTGRKKTRAKITILSDASDGFLQRVPLAYGSVEGIIGLDVPDIPAEGSATLYHWVAASNCYHGLDDLQCLVEERGPESFIIRTRNHWRAWVNKESVDFMELPEPIRDLYKRSLIIMRTQIDNRGAIIAGTDSDISRILGDVYSYVWGRDGAFAAHALDVAGYGEVSRNFYQFCADTITSEGYLLHKYTSDGALASYWMPWSDQRGNLQLPIQEDETALVVYYLWGHYTKYRDIEFIRQLYRRMIKNAADFMVQFREPNTRLPAPSYDLWEERRGIHSFTTAAVWAALQAAANFTDIFGEASLSSTYRQAAAEMKDAAIKHLFDKKQNRFVRSLMFKADGSVEQDYVIDSSISGLFLFGMFEPTAREIASTITAIKDKLTCKTGKGGVARYENDRYLQITQDLARVPGNPWFVCTLWEAQYLIAIAESLADLQPALDILLWACHCALPSGVLAEQINPYNCKPVGVSPLTWSHAALITAVQEYLKKYRELQKH